MVKRIILLTLFVLVIETATTSFQSLRHEINTDFDNKEIIEVNLGIFKSRSRFECLTLCGVNERCLSYQYKRNSNICKLFEQDFINFLETRYVSEKYWRYYYIIRGCTLKKENCPQQQGFNYNAKLCFCFRVDTTTVLHTEAVDRCATYNSSLLKLDRCWKERHVRNYLEGQRDDINEVFIQGFRGARTSDFRYNDGSVIQYFNWDTHEPDRPLVASAAIRIVRESGYLWRDTRLTRLHQFICQME